MSLVYWLQQPGGTLVDITDRCRLYQFDMKESAEEGATAVNQFVIDDPDGDLELFGHRILAVEETEAVDATDRFVFVGFFGDFDIIRGPSDRTDAARQYVCEISDVNTIFGRRIMRGDDNDRPDETDVERVTWVEGTHEGDAIDDTRYLSSSDPVDMDANDYLLQEALAVYSDCSQQSGKNYFVTYFGDVGVTTDTPWGSFSLWYGDAGEDVYNSTATLTNILSEVDVENGAFYIGLQEETKLSRKSMRVYSDVIVPFKNAYVSASNPTTRSTFARRDRVMPAANVSKKTTAQARAARYVKDLATPEDRATVKTTVPRELVNLIRPGMQVPVKVSHWSEEYRDDWVNMRVLSRQVKEISEDPTASFELTLELSRGVPGPPPAPLYGVIYGSDGPHDELVYFARTGDNPGPGWEVRPKTGLIDYLEDMTPPHGRPFYGFEVLGTGTIDVTGFLTTYGIRMNDIAYTWTIAICLNGTPVETESVSPPPGNLAPYGWDPVVSTTGLAVVPGDLITLELASTPSLPAFWRTPRGSGQNGERLEITGGSLS